MAAQNGVVALTDRRWFEFLRGLSADGRLDEVNFWRPLAQTAFRPLVPGEPFFFRLKHPVNAIVGYGFFAHATRLPIQLAWEAFGQRNGDPTIESFVARIAEYRRESPLETALGSRELTCLILREARFLPRHEWLLWEEDHGWHPSIVAFKTYDLASADGVALTDLLKNGRPAEFVERFEPVLADERARTELLAVAREGQGAFRVRVLDAYARRCAVTGERALPVLDAAHIQRYLGPASNHVQNGLALRADIHRLYDAGYVTVTPEYRVEVSRRLKDDFENGEPYYQLAGTSLVVLPSDPGKRPSRQALEWHASTIFRT
jgi:putative restriction endonuclease